MSDQIGLVKWGSIDSSNPVTHIEFTLVLRPGKAVLYAIYTSWVIVDFGFEVCGSILAQKARMWILDSGVEFKPYIYNPGSDITHTSYVLCLINIRSLNVGARTV